MNLSNYETMDPNLLVGLVNTALRNDCEDIADLAKTHDLNRDTLEDRLRSMGYHYIAEQNQFKAGV